MRLAVNFRKVGLSGGLRIDTKSDDEKKFKNSHVWS